MPLPSRGGHQSPTNHEAVVRFRRVDYVGARQETPGATVYRDGPTGLPGGPTSLRA